MGFWMGIARVGRYVAQVNFTPTGENDIDEVTFQRAAHPRPGPPLRAAAAQP